MISSWLDHLWSFHRCFFLDGDKHQYTANPSTGDEIFSLQGGQGEVIRGTGNPVREEEKKLLYYSHPNPHSKNKNFGLRLVQS